jgi:hypothetical protein
MTNLPATMIEAEALAFAREKVRFFRDNPVPFMGGPEFYWLDKADNRRPILQIIKTCALSHPTTMMEIADVARAGWSLAHDALRELILEFKQRHEELPTYLDAYNMEIVHNDGRPRHVPGKRKADYFLRDIAILIVVGLVVDRFGFHPTRDTRGKGRRNLSACYVVSQALGEERLGLGEAAVAKVWSKLGHNWRPDLQ